MNLRRSPMLPPRVVWQVDAGGPVFSLAMAEDGSRVLAGTNGGDALLLDASGRRLWKTALGGPVFGTAILPDDRFLLATKAGRLLELDVKGEMHGLAWEAPAEAKVLWGIDATASGHHVAVGGANGVCLLSWPSRRLLWRVAAGDDFWHVAVCEAAQRVLASSRSHHAALFDFDGRELWRHSGSMDFIGAALSQSGDAVVVGAWDYTITSLTSTGHVQWVWRTARGKSPKGLSITPAGSLVAVVTESETSDARGGHGDLLVLDPAGCLCLAYQLEGSIQDVAFSADGRFIGLGTQRGQIVLLEISPGSVATVVPFCGSRATAWVEGAPPVHSSHGGREPLQ